MTKYCIVCSSPLSGNQRKFCSHRCRDIHWKEIFDAELARPGRRPHIQGAWEYARTVTMARDNFACVQCGKTGTRNEPLHVHHRVSLEDGGDSSIDNLITLCSSCHYRAHRIRPKRSRPRRSQSTLLQMGSVQRSICEVSV